MNQGISQYYPVLQYKGQSLSTRTCIQCACLFWHIDSTIVYCGSNSCNTKNPELKYFKKNSSYGTLKQFLGGYRSFFETNHPSFITKTNWAGNKCTTIKNSSTRMSFMAAGICLYEHFFVENSSRLEHFSNQYMLTSQFCYRFEDSKNVETTSRHSSGFFMLGLHAFESGNQKFPETWKADFGNNVLDYYVSQLKIPLECIYIHGDSWTDGVRRGPSLEFFIKGIESGNMVFTVESTQGSPLENRYLDVGLGLQRLYSAITEEKNIYFNSVTMDSLRTIVIALKDQLYPAKLNIGYNVRKKMETILKSDPELKNIQTNLETVFEGLEYIEDPRLNEQLMKEIINIFSIQKKRCEQSKIL